MELDGYNDEDRQDNRKQLRNELRSSPTALAFFAALDQSKSSSNDRSNGNSLIERRIKTLGWRNRHSQSELYPVSLDIFKDHVKSSVEFNVLQVQRGEVEGTYGTGATVWPASMVLLKYMEKHSRELIEGKTIVDLGSGTGITSIGAVLLGADKVVCTDGEDSIVRLAQDNMTRCSQSESASMDASRLVVRKYWWGMGTLPLMDPDVILASDCVLPKLYPIAPLVAALDVLLCRTAAIAVLSYEHRYYPDYDPRDRFRELCTEKGLLVELIPVENHHDVYAADDIEIWHVRRQMEK